MAAVLVLQALNGLSDREAAEVVTFDLRWKAACGYAVAEPEFHPTTLTYWRRRPAGADLRGRLGRGGRDRVAHGQNPPGPGLDHP